MEVKQVLHMNGGEDNQSYAKNSSPQRFVVLNAKSILEESVEELLGGKDVQSSSCIRIAELGCSSGPNALIGVENIIANILTTKKNILEIQIFLNDLEANDFNTIFKSSLPEFYGRLQQQQQEIKCFVAAMPGSFYNRLFPTRSIHLVNCSNSLHWLSQVPLGLVSKSGEYLNKGYIYIAKSSRPEVQKAYLEQFDKDFTLFLKLRSEELVFNGHLVLTIMSKNDDDYYTRDAFGFILQQMVKEGKVKEEKLDSFNMPVYGPSAEEMKDIIDKEGSFKILHHQTFKHMWGDVYQHHTKNNANNGGIGNYISMFTRAAFEPLFVSHFGNEIIDELFLRYANTLTTNRVHVSQISFNNVVVSLVNNI